MTSSELNNNFLLYASQGNIVEVSNLISHSFNFFTLLHAYKLTFIRGMKLKPNNELRKNMMEQIEDIRIQREESVKKIPNYVDEPLYVLSDHLLACAELIYDKLQYHLNNYTNIILYLMLLCRLGDHHNYKDEFKNNYTQYPNININKRIKRGKSLFHVACKYGHMNVISLLIDKAKINKQTKHHDKIHQTPLHLAIEHFHVDVVKLLISYKANLNGLDYYKRLPIHYVAPGKTGNQEIFELLINNGVSVDSKYNGITMLYQAVEDNEIEIIKYLLSLKASPFVPSLIPKTNIYQYVYQSPFELACKDNKVEIINLFKKIIEKQHISRISFFY